MINYKTRSQAFLEACDYQIRKLKMTEKKKLKLVTDEQSEIDARKREAKVFELRIQGYTFEQIASEVGYQGTSGAWQAYRRARESMIFESVEEARQLELLRLDEMMFALWDRAIGGDLPSASCVLKIMDRRAKLLGLDKPEKIEVNKWDFDGADLDAEVQKLVTMMNEREEEFMERREAEVRAEMRAQFEVEKKLEKELQSKKLQSDSKAKLLEFLGTDANEEKEG
jgi:hypothetical protein